jgi:hypothetical protein
LEKHIWALFRGEIQKNCDFALLAYGDMMKHSQLEEQNEKDRSNRIWLSIELFLIAVANISKILWPSRPPKCPECEYQPELSRQVFSRAKDLRIILSVREPSPLEKRSFRNFFEHYDFELDDWASESNKQLVYDSNVGPIELIIKSSNKPLIIRHFDQYKSMIYYRGRQYHVKPVVEALKELKAKAEMVSL